MVVIGAGAAGLMAAAEAALAGASVVLLEKNGKTGVKILMSGGTRCNITQDTDARGIVKAFGRAGRFLQKSVGAFGPDQVVKLFNDAGVGTKVESTGKIFPTSDRAVHVRDALHARAVEAGVHLHLRSGVLAVAKQDDGWAVRTEDAELACDRVIVTAGGKSWPGCGTTGDAYAWLHGLGHTIVKTRPALVPLVGGYGWSHALSGLTLDDCVASVYESTQWKSKSVAKRKPLVQRRSSWLFTHFGFSGPAAMDVSGTLTGAGGYENAVLSVDFVPGLSADEIQSACTNRAGGGKRSVATVVNNWLPSRLAESIVAANDCNASIAELPGAKLQALIAGLKRSVFPVQGTKGFAKAEVTAGGVKLSEVNPRTMESKLCPGLFIAGEVLDVDGWIGGYNFQAAFSTGRAAGLAAAGEAG